MVGSENTYIQFKGDGHTTVFEYPYDVAPKSELKALYVDTQGKTKDVTENITVEGRKVTYPRRGDAMPTGGLLVVYRDTEITQTMDFPDKYPYDNIETEFDYITRILQELDAKLDRSLQVPIHSSHRNLTIPDSKERAFIGWSNTGEELTTYPVANFENMTKTVKDGYDYVKGTKAKFDGDLLTIENQIKTIETSKKLIDNFVAIAKQCSEKAKEYKNLAKEIVGGDFITRTEAKTLAKTSEVKKDIENIKSNKSLPKVLSASYSSEVSDLNELVIEGIYTVLDGIKNLPTTEEYFRGRVMVLNEYQDFKHNGGVLYQVCFSNNINTIWIRMYKGNDKWSNWTKLALDEDLKALESTVDTKTKTLESTIDTKVKSLESTIDSKTKVPSIDDMDLIFDGSKFNGGFGAWSDTIEFTKPWDTYDTLYIIYFNGDKDYIYNTTINVALTKRMLEVTKAKGRYKITMIETGHYNAVTNTSTSTKWVNYSTNMHILYIYGYKQGGASDT